MLLVNNEWPKKLGHHKFLRSLKKRKSKYLLKCVSHTSNGQWNVLCWKYNIWIQFYNYDW